PVWAKLALLGTAFSYACAALYAKRFSGMRPELVATGQLTASTVVMVPVVLLTFGVDGLFDASAPAWLSVFALALASTALAYTIFFRLLRTAGATNTSLVTLLVPMSAILLGVLILGERLAAFEIAGIALIVAGLLVIDGRILARLR